MKLIAWVGVLLLCAGPLLVTEGAWLALAIAAATGSVYVLRGATFNLVDIHFLGIRTLPLLLALTAISVAFWQGAGALQSSLPFLLVAGLLTIASAALGHLNITAGMGFSAFAVTGIATGSWAVWQHIAQGARRAAGFEPLHAILYGNLSLTVGLICLAGLAWAWQCSKRYWWLLLCGFGAFGGLVASLLSGTRGGWIALPLAGLLFYRVYLRSVPRKWPLLILTFVVLSIATVYSLPQTGVQYRVNSAIAEGQDYLKGDAHGSIGIRLELYRTGLALIGERPVLGYSIDEYSQAMQSIRDTGGVSRLVAKQWHAHNDILNAWLRYGVVGMLVTLLLYVVPFGYFASKLSGAQRSQRPIVLAGMLVPVLFFDFGLTYSFFAYPVVFATYWLWILLLVGIYCSSSAMNKPV